ncbi:caspase domain-containing protein [Streptomyces sp. NPDC090025]|uniref:caspase family protein n=1 Tax=Streptomyces sp. NPDC090025 TaxID=3365922 RepID=UPI00383587AD
MIARYRALLVGNGYFPHEPALAPLHGPFNDVAALAQALTDPGVGLFDPHDVTLLPDRDGEEILYALQEMCTAAGRDDLLLLYYSGHGLPGDLGTGSLRLCARDTVLSRERDTAIGFPQLDRILRTSAAAVTLVVLDCCYSGAAKGAPDARHLAVARGRCIMTACRERETTPDAVNSTSLSRFTSYLVAGLRSGPDRRGAEDTRISDLFEFALRRMAADGAGPLPTQRVSSTGASPHVPIARLPPLPAPPAPGPPPASLGDTAPPWLRGAARWVLFLLLTIGALVGATGTSAITDDLA